MEYINNHKINLNGNDVYIDDVIIRISRLQRYILIELCKSYKNGNSLRLEHHRQKQIKKIGETDLKTDLKAPIAKSTLQNNIAFLKKQLGISMNFRKEYPTEEEREKGIDEIWMYEITSVPDNGNNEDDENV